MKKFLLTLLVALMVLGVMPHGLVKAQTTLPPTDLFSKHEKSLSAISVNGGVHPTPWFTVIAAYVRIKGQPVVPGTGVEFYCQGRLAGYGETYDYDADNLGILGFTHVYGSDLTSDPQVLMCDDNDLITAKVNGLQAVMTPIQRWHNDWETKIVDIDLDSNILFNWEQPISAMAVNVADRQSSVRQSKVGNVNFDVIPDELPFYMYTDLDQAVSYSLTDMLDRTFLYSSHDYQVCQSGPQFVFIRGNGNSVIHADNTTGETIQIMLTLETTTGPFGLLPSTGGSFELRNQATYGSIEFRLNDQNGPTCAKIFWDYRDLPAPRVVAAEAAVSINGRTVKVTGDNFLSYMEEEFDPSNMYVRFIGPGQTSTAYSMNDVMAMGGVWNNREMTVKLPFNFPAGDYQVKVSILEKSSSEAISVTIPDPILFHLFLPNIGR